MLPVHIHERLKQRGLSFSEIFIRACCKDYSQKDTALVLAKLPEEREFVGNENSSNGDLVILIIRSGKPVTIMFRRSNNQPLSPQALRVEEIKIFNKDEE